MDDPPILCIAGKNQVALDVLDRALRRNKWRVVVHPNAGDVGEDAWQPSLLAAARARSVETVPLEWLKQQESLCFLSVEYDRLIEPREFRTDRLFNIHFSLLPRYRGCNTAIWPILNGEEAHGVTLHWIDSGMDTGPIIDQITFPIGTMTARDLYFRCMEEGVRLIDAWLDCLVSGEVPAHPQDNAQASSYARSALDFGRAAIDPTGTVNQVLRTVRAFHFPEFQLARLGSANVVSAHVVSNPEQRVPGTQELRKMGILRIWLCDGAVDLTLSNQAN